MSESTQVLLLGVAPVFVLLIYIYLLDSNEREPLSLLLRALFFGFLVVPLVFLVHGVLTLFGIDVQATIFSRAFVSAGLIEEASKLLMLYLAVWRSRYFNERFDGIVYAVFVSLGFALVENLIYLFVYVPEAAMQTGFMRAITAVPMHFLLGVLMGYYVGLARFNPRAKSAYLFLALLFATVAHGVYDYLLMLADSLSDVNGGVAGGLVIAAYLFIIIFWRSAHKRMRLHKEKDLH